jgi:hypothetical protein
MQKDRVQFLIDQLQYVEEQHGGFDQIHGHIYTKVKLI